MEESISSLRNFVETGKELIGNESLEDSKMKRFKDSLDIRLVISELMKLPAESWWTRTADKLFSTAAYRPLEVELGRYSGISPYFLFLRWGAINFEKTYRKGFESTLEELYNTVQRKVEEKWKK